MSCADSKQCNNTLLPSTKFLFENEALETKWSNLTGFGVTTVLASSITGNYIKEVFSQSFILIKAQLTLNRPGGGGGIRPQAGSSHCCAETVCSRKLKLSDFSYILIGLNSEYKPVSWDIHCYHGNAIVEGCSVKFWLKSVINCIFCSNRFLISV